MFTSDGKFAMAEEIMKGDPQVTQPQQPETQHQQHQPEQENKVHQQGQEQSSNSTAARCRPFEPKQPSHGAGITGQPDTSSTTHHSSTFPPAPAHMQNPMTLHQRGAQSKLHTATTGNLSQPSLHPSMNQQFTSAPGRPARQQRETTLLTGGSMTQQRQEQSLKSTVISSPPFGALQPSHGAGITGQPYSSSATHISSNVSPAVKMPDAVILPQQGQQSNLHTATTGINLPPPLVYSSMSQSSAGVPVVEQGSSARLTGGEVIQYQPYDYQNKTPMNKRKQGGNLAVTYEGGSSVKAAKLSTSTTAASTTLVAESSEPAPSDATSTASSAKPTPSAAASAKSTS